MRLLDGRQKLIRWISPLCEAAPDALPDRIAIRHVSVNDRISDVGAIALPQQIDPDALAQLAETLETAVQSDAEGLGGLQRYLLLMLKGDTQISRLPLRVSGSETNDSGEPLDSEPATLKGLLAQLMRHNEMNTRSMSFYSCHALSAMQRTIDQQQTMIDSAGEQRLRYLAATEGLLSEQNNRDLATAETTFKLQQKADVWEKVVQLLPVLLAKFLPAGPAGKASGPDSFAVLLRSFFDTFTDEQFEGLQRVLSQQQMMAVFALMEKVKEQTDKNDANNGVPREAGEHAGKGRAS